MMAQYQEKFCTMKRRSGDHQIVVSRSTLFMLVVEQAGRDSERVDYPSHHRIIDIMMSVNIIREC